MYSDSTQCASSELAETRVELARLQKQEKELVRKLGQKICHVRAAIQVQKTKLDKLMPAPIDRLSNELLVRVLKLSIRESALELVGVSRRWRDVVLHWPSLWTTIRITERMSLPELKTHVSKSSESLLDIEIHLETVPLLSMVLDALIPCAHRWRSFIIRCSNHSLLKDMLTMIECTTYPSLTYLSIRNIFREGPPSMTSQFYSRSFPCLEHFELEGNVVHSSVLEVPPGVTSLYLGLRGIDILSTLQHSPLQKLTSLLIAEYELGRGMQLKPDSIHLPLLETFVYHDGPSVLIRAIAAPKLAYFEYDSDINCKIFKTRAPKFPNVVRLVLRGASGRPAAVPFAFPAARHIDLTHPEAAESLFSPKNGSITGVHWPHLESLTIRNVRMTSLDFLDGLVRWLKARRDMDASMLLIRFAFYNPAQEEGVENLGVVTALPEAGSIVTVLYEALHGLCKLGWVDVPLAGIVLSGTLHESLRLVCILHPVVTSRLTPFPYRRIPISLRISARQSFKDVVSEAVQDLLEARQGYLRTVITA